MNRLPDSDMRLETPSLILIASTSDHARLAIADPLALGRLLECDGWEEWPPETLADVQQFFADRLAANPDQVVWWGWYVCAKPGGVGPRAVVVGSAGVCQPGAFGPLAIMGYSTLPKWEGRGFASQAARAIADWALSQVVGGERIDHLYAETFTDHHASRRILDKTGFVLEGVSPNDSTAAESDRQGRGALLRYRKDRLG
jgi:RimJ/RimL family protein N-acetyltransferase